MAVTTIKTAYYDYGYNWRNAVRSAPNRKIEYIVMHYMACPNSDNNRARNTAAQFCQGTPSADYCVDDSTIIRVNPDSAHYYTVHVNVSSLEGFLGGGTLLGKCTNYNSIGIEMANYTTDRQLPIANSPKNKFSKAVIDNAVWLTRYLMHAYNIDVDHVVRQYDVDGKLCPGVIGWNAASGDESEWLAFKARLTAPIETSTPPSEEEQIIKPEVPYSAKVLTDTLDYYENYPTAADTQLVLKGQYTKDNILAIAQAEIGISESGAKELWVKTAEGVWVKGSNIEKTEVTVAIKDYLSDKLANDVTSSIVFPIEDWYDENGNYIYAVKDDKTLETLLEAREEEYQKHSLTIISNNELVKNLKIAYTSSNSAEDYEQKVKLLFRDASNFQASLVESPFTNFMVKTSANALTTVSESAIQEKIENNKADVLNYYKELYNDKGWNKNVDEAPETLNFWIDFMSAEGEMGKYAVQNIGNRPKAIKDDKVKAIYFKEVPTVLFYGERDTVDFTAHQGYTFAQFPFSMQNYFAISSQGKSAQDELNNLLYQHTCSKENVNLTAVPIYYLQPNTRIFVKDDNTGINGEYIVDKVTVPLQYNGTTAITATKAVERIY